MKLVLALTFVVALSAVACAASKPQLRTTQQEERSWSEYGGSFYTGGASSVTWSDARVACRQIHHLADLPAVHSTGEQQFLVNTFGSSIWIGLNDIVEEAHYVWANGDEIDFTEWYMSGSYAQDCVHFSPEASGAWEGVKCSQNLPFACKIGL